MWSKVIERNQEDQGAQKKDWKDLTPQRPQIFYFNLQ
jgi:hypothetical protein